MPIGAYDGERVKNHWKQAIINLREHVFYFSH